MISSAIRAVQTLGGQAGLSTFIFHRVLPHTDELFPGEVTRDQFDAICDWIAEWFKVIPLEEAVDRLRSRSLPPNAACITFDDGYADNHDVALPILKARGLCATFFIATGFLDGGCMWNDAVIEAVRGAQGNSLDVKALGIEGIHRLSIDTIENKRVAIERLIRSIKYLPLGRRTEVVTILTDICRSSPRSDLMMTSEQVRSMRRQGMQIGAHTINHPILVKLSDQQARDEIAGGREVLESLLNERTNLFAYPNGKPLQDYSARDVEIVRSLGFKAAASTVWGVTRSKSELFEMPRFTPWDRTRTRFGLRLLSNAFRRQKKQSHG